MKVLMITGDKNLFTPGTGAYERLALQRSSVEELTVVYWGRGSVWPKIPKDHFDVVTVQDPFLRGLFAWWVAKRSGALFNVQVHADLMGQSFTRRVLARIVLKQANSIRVVSQKIQIQVELLGTQAAIVVLPVFVDLSRFRHLQHRPRIQKNILWVGRFEQEKDPLLAITVLKEVHKTGVNVMLTMIGSGSLEKDIFLVAADLPIQTPLEVKGWQFDITLFLESADVVLCTSKHESWGASIVEALAAGVPVVAPDVGIAREAGAVVVEERSQLAQKVIEVLQTGVRGKLLLHLPDAREWAELWRESLTQRRLKQ